MITLVTLDAQQRQTIWAFESRSLVMPALIDYVSKNWRRAWTEKPEKIGDVEVKEYFANMIGMEDYLTFDVALEKCRRSTALSSVTDVLVSASSSVFLLHIMSEAIQGRPDNAVWYCLYIILALVARFGSRIWRNK